MRSRRELWEVQEAYWAARRRGFTNTVAARLVGVHRRQGRRWAERIEAAGEPIPRARSASPRYLSLTEREQIADGYCSGPVVAGDRGRGGQVSFHGQPGGCPQLPNPWSGWKRPRTAGTDPPNRPPFGPERPGPRRRRYPPGRRRYRSTRAVDYNWTCSRLCSGCVKNTQFTRARAPDQPPTRMPLVTPPPLLILKNPLRCPWIQNGVGADASSKSRST